MESLLEPGRYLFAQVAQNFHISRAGEPDLKLLAIGSFHAKGFGILIGRRHVAGDCI
jgi:hypothetical protein